MTVISGPTAAPSIAPAADSPAVSEGGADVVYIRSQALWNVTNFNGTFNSAVQNNFTVALRQLLEPEAFMSIALTQVQVCILSALERAAEVQQKSGCHISSAGLNISSDIGHCCPERHTS